jgi:hypothetical protein
MSTIVTRAGKGSALTHNEVDANFTNLNTDKLQSGNTAAALTITSATVNGGAINATTVGATTAASGAFTTLSATGNVTLGDAATDTVTVNGYMGVGGTPSAARSVYVQSTGLTGTTQIGVDSRPVFSSAATAAGYGIISFPATAAAAFTQANLYGIGVFDATKGAGSTITNQFGIRIFNLTQGTNNYGLFSDVSSGTNKWNIYASGTAANYFAGNVGIGATSPGTRLHVNSGAVDEVARFEGTGSPYISFYDSGVRDFYIQDAASVNVVVEANKALTFYTNNIERTRITSGGDFQFNSGYGSVATAYGCRAWVNFDGTANSNLTGTYTRTSPSTTLTVSATAHGLITGNRVYLDFTSGTALDGEYVVTRISADSFTVTTVASTSTSGNVTLRQNTIRASGNVSSVADTGTGLYAVNFATAMPDANYAVTATSAMNIGSTDASVVVVDNFAGAQTAGAVQLFLEDVDAGGVDSPIVMVVIHR